MAEILGSRDCIESLHTDVADLQSAMLDVLSRVGPVSFRSWKYPDKESTALNIDELLQTYRYCDDLEERQLAHIILLELVIDRFILLLQVMGKFMEQISKKAGTGLRMVKSTSVGLVVKKYWSAVLQLNTQLDQLNSENKGKSRRISELEELHAKAKLGVPFGTPLDSALNTKDLSDIKKLPGSACRTNIVSPARDEYSKASQTIETAFVPCDSCHFVQQNLREVGNTVVNMCESLNLESSLCKHRNSVQKLEWFSANNVKQWAAEQNKDLISIGKHLEWLMSTVNPLNEQVNELKSRNKDMAASVAKHTEQYKAERQNSGIMKKQYEGKLKDLEKSKSDLDTELQKLKADSKQVRLTFEEELDKMKAELKRQKQEFADMECSRGNMLQQKQQQMEEDISKVENDFKATSMKLEETLIELKKQKAVNRSANEHNEAEQSKQDLLRLRLDDIDQENGFLREQIASLEEAKDKLHEKVEAMKVDHTQFQKLIEEKEHIAEELRNDKAKLESSVQRLEDAANRLENELKEVKEKMRIMVEYPDLHPTANANLSGTGNIAKDMENQLQANQLRIQLLQEENAKLHKSITKLLSMTSTSGQSHENDYSLPAKLIPLWKHNNQQGASKVLNNESLFQPQPTRQEASTVARTVVVASRAGSASSGYQDYYSRGKEAEPKWRKATLSDTSNKSSSSGYGRIH